MSESLGRGSGETTIVVQCDGKHALYTQDKEALSNTSEHPFKKKLVTTHQL